MNNAAVAACLVRRLVPGRPLPIAKPTVGDPLVTAAELALWDAGVVDPVEVGQLLAARGWKINANTNPPTVAWPLVEQEQVERDVDRLLVELVTRTE